MSTKRETAKALRLAEEITTFLPPDPGKHIQKCIEAAQELRDQHELVQKLKAALVNANALSPCPMYSEAIDAAEAHK